VRCMLNEKVGGGGGGFSWLEAVPRLCLKEQKDYKQKGKVSSGRPGGNAEAAGILAWLSREERRKGGRGAYSAITRRGKEGGQ